MAVSRHDATPSDQVKLIHHLRGRNPKFVGLPRLDIVPIRDVPPHLRPSARPRDKHLHATRHIAHALLSYARPDKLLWFSGNWDSAPVMAQEAAGRKDPFSLRPTPPPHPHHVVTVDDELGLTPADIAQTDAWLQNC